LLIALVVGSLSASAGLLQTKLAPAPPKPRRGFLCARYLQRMARARQRAVLTGSVTALCGDGSGAHNVRFWHKADITIVLNDVRFSNRPFGVKRFWLSTTGGVDVTRRLVLLSGIGT